MRKLIAALSAAALLALGGCAQSIYVNYRDIESLRVVQALGLDAAADGGVVLSAASGPDASGREPLRLTREGESLDAAMRELEALTGGGQLFFAGTGAIVLGEAAADEAARWLDAVTRSKELRLDTELYVLRGGEAAELLCGEDAPEDVFAALDALAQRLRRNGPSPAPGCADAARALTGSGAALAAAIELEKGAEGKLTPVPAGFAVLTDSGLAAWLEDEAALGAGIFAGGPGAALLELGGVTVELAGAKASLSRFGRTAALRRFASSWRRAEALSALPRAVSRTPARPWRSSRPSLRRRSAPASRRAGAEPRHWRGLPRPGPEAGDGAARALRRHEAALGGDASGARV